MFFFRTHSDPKTSKRIGMFAGGPTTPHKDGGGEYSGFSGAEKSTGFAAAADASISVTTSGIFRRFDSFPLFSFSKTLDVMDVIKLTLRFKFKSVFFVVGISLPCHIDIFTASTKLSNGKLLSDSLVPQEADVMSFLQGDQAQPLTWGGDGLGVLPRWRCFFFRFLTHSQVDKSPDFQLTLTSGVRILSKGFALLDNNTTTLPQKLWKKANSGMSTKCLYLLRSISVEIQPRNSGFKIAHWRGDLTSKRTCLVPKRCFKRIILDVYVQVTTISLRYSYSLRIPFVYKNYIYSTGDVI